MGNSFSCRRLVGCRVGQVALAEVCGLVEMTKKDHAEVDRVDAVIDLGDADGLADQGLAEEDLRTLPFDFAVLTYPADLMVGRILGLLRPTAIGPRRRLDESGGSLLSESLVRTHLIEDATEVVEAPLLGTQAFCRWARRLRLESSMHTLVTAVLLRLARLNALRTDAGLDQFDRQLRQPARSGRRKRRTIIR